MRKQILLPILTVLVAALILLVVGIIRGLCKKYLD